MKKSIFKSSRWLSLSLFAGLFVCAQPAAVAQHTPAFNNQWSWWSYTDGQDVAWLWTVAPNQTEYGWVYLSAENNKILGTPQGSVNAFEMASQIGLAPNSLVGKFFLYEVSAAVSEILTFTSETEVTVTITVSDSPTTQTYIGSYSYATSSRSEATLVVVVPTEGVGNSGVVAGFQIDFTTSSTGVFNYLAAASANVPEGPSETGSRFMTLEDVRFNYYESGN